MTALRIGLVGRGRWGKVIERTLLGFPDVALTAIDRNTPPPSLDGVIIATPAATHAELALPYIERGIATFIEKPMTASTADAERLAAAARRSGSPIFVGHIYLYNPAFLALRREMLRLGGVRYILCEGMNDETLRSESVLWEWLPHHLSMARAILDGDPQNVESWTLGDQRAVISRFLFGSTFLVSHASWLSSAKRRRITVVGEQGTVVFDDAAERKLALHANGTVSHPAVENDLPLTAELRAFIDTVRSGRSDRDHLADGTVIVRVIAAAELSLRERHPVAL